MISIYKQSSFFLICSICLMFVGCKKKTATETLQTSASKEKPNVVIILADDLGYGDISTYGLQNQHTPEIDKIAAEGALCTDFYVPTPYCAPSRATLLTGRFPLRHGLIKNPAPDASVASDTIGLSTKEITMAELFKASGYSTKAIGKWHLGHQASFFPVEQGFDEYYGILYSNDMRPVQIIQDKDTIVNPVDQQFLTKNYTSKALDFIKRKKGEPFFLYLAHAMPHKPLAASDRFYTPETPNDLYTDVINELDWSVGEVMNTLKELDILDNTIVIFMSDNGPWYGGNSGGFKGMKATTWEGGIRVPFMIRYPKAIPSNKTVAVPMWSADILPTLLSLTDIAPSESNKLDGQNITEILKGNSSEHAPVFSMHNDEIMSIRKGDYKLFLNKPNLKVMNDVSSWKDKRGPDGKTIIAPIIGQANPSQYPGVIPEKPKQKIQLFNLKKDPTESLDLSASNQEKVKELMKDYQNFKNSFDTQ